MEKLRKFNAIAAASENMGIGYKGDIPWRLKNEMAYFTKMTTTTNDNKKKNAVIMGRKTWESIPPKYKPLPNRFNIVISTTIKKTGFEEVPVFSSLTEALSYLSKPSQENDIESIWLIGGSALYKEGISSPLCSKIYLTRVKGNFESDTFFPEVPSHYKEIKEEGVPSEIQEEKGIQYRYTVLENTSEVDS